MAGGEQVGVGDGAAVEGDEGWAEGEGTVGRAALTGVGVEREDAGGGRAAQAGVARTQVDPACRDG
jgi:hypothetical protein